MANKTSSSNPDRERRRRDRPDTMSESSQCRAFLDGMPQGVAIYEAVNDGEDFIFRAFNAAAERIEGFSRTDLLGKSVLETFPGVRNFGLFDVFQRVWRTGLPERLPIALYQDDKLAVWRDNYVFRLPSGELAAVYNDARERKLLEEQLAESEERWKFAIEGSGDGLWDWKIPTGEVFFSKRWKTMLGFEEHELSGSVEEWTRRVHPDDLEQVQSEVRRCLEGQSDAYVCEHRVRCKDGSYKWILDRGKVVSRTPDNKPLRMVGTHTDVTERKNFERAQQQSEERLSKIIRYSPQLFFLCTRATERFLEINDAFTRMLGYTRDEAIGTSTTALGIWADEGEHRALLARFEQQGEVVDAELRFRRKDASQLVGLCSVAPFDIDGEPCLLVMGVDITARKEAEQGMRTARLEAEQANQAKSDFLARMSHEIRTPINAVMGLSHLLLRSGLNVRQRDYVSKITTASRSLLGIINDILDFSRIEAGKLAIEQVEFRVEDVLDTLASLVTHQAEAKGIELIVDLGRDVPSRLVGDALRLGQVLVNLVGNAIKFTERGEVLVSVQHAATQAQGQGQTATLRFGVQDTGIGISPEELDRLFQSFAQADGSITRRYGGTGLGLVISKRLVDLMGGNIEVHSEPGQGSTFTFSLSFPVVEHVEPVRPPSSFNPTGLKVLVVDDSPTAGQIIAAYLESFQFQPHVVTSGAQALEALRAAPEDDPYSLLLLDWKMPGMDGIETMERINADDSIHGAATAILVTAYDAEDLQSRARAAGIAGVLAKPVSPTTLYNTIQKAVHAAPATEESGPGLREASVPQFDGLPLLLVEDNPINQQVAAELLASVGFRVDIANNGLEALKRLDLSPYAGVLMDVQMPGLDGYETTREIRRQERFKELPIIAMTAHALVGEKEKCLDAGMNDFTAKPIEPELLFSTLAQWIPPVRWDRPTRLPGFDAGPLTGLPDLLPGLNLRKGLATAGDNLKRYGDLLHQFLELYGEAATTVDAAISTGDLDFLIHFAHGARGVAGNLGMIETSRALELLEQAATIADTQTMTSALAQVRTGLTHAVESAHLVLKRIEMLPLAAPATAALDSRELVPALRTLRNALRNAEYVEETLLDAILASTAQGELREQALLLKRLVTEFSYDKALDQLQHLAGLLGLEFDD